MTHSKEGYVNDVFLIIETGMCTGTFYEEGRPSAGTKCVKPCVIESARWGSSYCYTEGGNWGAECVTCPGKIHHYNRTNSNVRKIVSDDDEHNK